jgi:5-methyltetrahydropteroyltriglutamate--homocysteine methyltransferase
VIAASALSLIYPQDGVDGYERDAFLDDLVDACEQDIRSSLDRGAHRVQIDFTEGRLSIKLDPSGGVLRDFVALNNRVLARFSDDDRARIGVHTCPGGDQDSTHSADVDYAQLLPELFAMNVGTVYVMLAGEEDREGTLKLIAEHLRPDQRIFVGVIDPIDPRVESAEEVRDRVLEAADLLPVDRLGTCDDCGFSPFADDTSTSRDVAFAKIAARVEGTRLASEQLGA